MNRRTTLGLSCVLAADIATITVLRAVPGETLALLGHPHVWLAAHGSTLGAVAMTDAAAFLVACWLGFGTAAAVLTAAPGAAGRLGAAVARVVVPRAVLRLAAGAAGLGILAAGAGAADAADLGRPAPVAAVAFATGSTGTLPAPQLPTDPLPADPLPADPLPDDPLPADTRPAVPPAGPAASGPTSTVEVRPGDSLWRIAQRALGPRATPARVATTWPQWFAANREVIGPDPGYLVPGEVLHTPDQTAPAAHR